jgi:hypothetical protein
MGAEVFFISQRIHDANPVAMGISKKTAARTMIVSDVYLIQGELGDGCVPVLSRSWYARLQSCADSY